MIGDRQRQAIAQVNQRPSEVRCEHVRSMLVPRIFDVGLKENPVELESCDSYLSPNELSNERRCESPVLTLVRVGQGTRSAVYRSGWHAAKVKGSAITKAVLLQSLEETAFEIWRNTWNIDRCRVDTILDSCEFAESLRARVS